MSEPHPGAGTPAPKRELINVARLIAAYYTEKPDCSLPEHRVAFGTSGHRGSARSGSFNEPHILAITQAVAEYRRREGTDGPLFLGMDTHALSEPAFRTTLEVLAANGVATRIDARDGFTPTPAISHAIVAYNRERSSGFADGIVITPSHNPPEDGGYKYNPPSGGPADTGTTSVIEDRANELMVNGCVDVRRIPFERALRSDFVSRHDFIEQYVEGIGSAIDLEAVRSAGIKLGADPMGGSGAAYWEPLAERYGLDLTVTNDDIDPRFAFMPRDRDGVIRMDCSSPFAMARLIDLKDRFDVAFANDTDFDRHGIVTRTTGLVAPNPYLAVAIDYLFRHRDGWPKAAAIGKTLVSSGMIDRVARRIGRPVIEVPVGFKWFVDGLLDGSLGFGGEESAGASFLDRQGRAWSTDKDGILLDLLAAEITAVTGRDPGEAYRELTAELGEPVYARISAPADRNEKAALKNLSPENLAGIDTLAGEAIDQVLTAAPGNGAAIGGLKVAAKNGWFAARPSGTEDIYKIYAESFLGDDHLARIQLEAREIVSKALAAA